MFRVQVTTILCFIALLASGCSQISILNIGEKYFPQEVQSYSDEKVSKYSDTQNKIAVLLPLSGAQKKQVMRYKAVFLLPYIELRKTKSKYLKFNFMIQKI